MAIRQLSALYLTAASAYVAAIVLSQHPVLADRAGEASAFLRSTGGEAALAVDNYVVRPAIRLAERDVTLLARDIASRLPSEEPPTVAELQLAPFDPHAERLAADTLPGAPPQAERRESELRESGRRRAHHRVNVARRESLPDESVRQEARNSARNSTAPTGDEASPGAPVAAAPEQLARTEPVQQPLQMAPGTVNTSVPPAAASQSLSSIPAGPGPGTAELARVEARLKDSLTSEMIENFALFLYVSKAASGPLAQRMYVFEKQPSGDLDLAYNWPVSTGRERIEYNAAGRLLPSFTPAGYFELDPHRFYPHYVSHQWHEPMPHAMFFNWQKNGLQTGLAIHSATGNDIGLLGTRASAGCIRLAPDAARTLFNLIKTNYRGLTPRFAIDRRTGTMSTDGIMLHDPNGKVQVADGYKVLVFIEDYGGQSVVAAMY